MRGLGRYAGGVARGVGSKLAGAYAAMRRNLGKMWRGIGDRLRARLADAPMPTRLQSKHGGFMMPRNPKSAVVTINKQVGDEWDNYVARKQLRGLDEAGQLGRHERLATPDLKPGRNYVIPDYAIYDANGRVAAYADAKAVQSGVIPLDDQARGFIKWAAESESKRFIYYVPWETRAHRKLLEEALRHDVDILFVMVE